MVLKIYYKSFLVYLGIGGVMVETIAIGKFAFRDLAG